MDKTGALLIVANTAVCTIAAMALAWLGWQFDHAGMGLNPLVAYPLATLFFAAPFAWVSSINEG